MAQTVRATSLLGGGLKGRVQATALGGKGKAGKGKPGFKQTSRLSADKRSALAAGAATRPRPASGKGSRGGRAGAGGGGGKK